MHFLRIFALLFSILNARPDSSAVRSLERIKTVTNKRMVAYLLVVKANDNCSKFQMTIIIKNYSKLMYEGQKTKL